MPATRFSITLQLGDPRENFLGLQLPYSMPSSTGAGRGQRLRARLQGLLEEDNFDMVSQGSGKCGWNKCLKVLHRKNEGCGWDDSNLYTTVVTMKPADSSKPELQPNLSHSQTLCVVMDMRPDAQVSLQGFTVPATERAVSGQPSAVSLCRDCLTQSHTSTSDGGRGIKAEPFWSKVGQV